VLDGCVEVIFWEEEDQKVHQIALPHPSSMWIIRELKKKKGTLVRIDEIQARGEKNGKIAINRTNISTFRERFCLHFSSYVS